MPPRATLVNGHMKLTARALCKDCRQRVLPGVGVPIVFEAGGGDDASVWGPILTEVRAQTGAPVIAYSRPGFGRSEIDTTRRGVAAGAVALDNGLKALGLRGPILIVSHSLGGFHTTAFAARRPARVAGVVLLDANLACFFTDEQLRTMQNTPEELARYRQQGMGRYFQAVDFDSTVALLRRTPFPTTIPVIDIVSEQGPVRDSVATARWRRCHSDFVASGAQREAIVAHATGHYIFRGAPELVVSAIIKAYARTQTGARRETVLSRGVAYGVNSIDAVKQREVAYRHSEADLNEWGYALLGQRKLAEAVAVLALNAQLRPTSENAHESRWRPATDRCPPDRDRYT